jgi:uncharacterized phage infection (PIP) family protein YhgE
LDKGGVTLDRITRGTHNAAEAQEQLSQTIRNMYSVANAMGVGLSEYADNLTNYVNDLGMSVETVNESFAQVADQASRSAFGTRRFYSMVTQATSGQASLNVHLEQTGDLLLRMSRIMGAKKAAEMVGGATSDLADMSAQDRAKTLLVAGGRGRRVYEREARTQAATFARDFSKEGAAPQRQAFQQALENVGLSSSGLAAAVQENADPQALVTSLSKISARDQRALLAQLRATGQDQMARRLEDLVHVTRGARGDLGAQVGGLGSFSAGGSLAMRAAQIQRFIDPTTGRVGVAQRAAAESVSGMSGQRMDAFLSLMEAQRGDLETMKSLGESFPISSTNRNAAKTNRTVWAHRSNGGWAEEIS